MPTPPPTRYTRVRTAAGAAVKGALGILRRLFAFGASPQKVVGTIRAMFPGLTPGQGSVLYQKAKQPFAAGRALTALPGAETLPAAEIPTVTPSPGQVGLGAVPGYHYRVTIEWGNGPRGKSRYYSTVVYSSQNRSADYIRNQAIMAWSAAVSRGDSPSAKQARLNPQIKKIEVRSAKRVTS